MSTKDMAITKHAQARMQQRNIPPLMIDLLYRYGREQSQDGATLLYLDKKGREHARDALLDITRRFDKLGGTYLVEGSDSGDLVTIGHRRRRIRRK
jgi:TPP-dependent pyruvate/acetoin dehydrogenase alpha subunit